MALVKSTGYIDTPIEGGVTSFNFPRPALNIKADFRVKSNTGNEVVLTNITSPIDRPEKIRIAASEVANIYTGSGIEPSLLAPSKKGVSILVQMTGVTSITDDTDPSYRVDKPRTYHIVGKVAADTTAAEIKADLGRLLSCVFDTGSDSLSRLEAILRGSLVPSEL